MPAQYLAIKRDLKKRGASDRVAKRIAAATYNKTHKIPVTGKHKKKGRR